MADKINLYNCQRSIIQFKHKKLDISNLHIRLQIFSTDYVRHTTTAILEFLSILLPFLGSPLQTKQRYDDNCIVLEWNVAHFETLLCKVLFLYRVLLLRKGNFKLIPVYTDHIWRLFTCTCNMGFDNEMNRNSNLDFGQVT